MGRPWAAQAHLENPIARTGRKKRITRSYCQSRCGGVRSFEKIRLRILVEARGPGDREAEAKGKASEGESPRERSRRGKRALRRETGAEITK